MTTLNEARTAIYQHFIAEWINGPNPLTPYCFDNESFDPPKTAAGIGLPWARCSVRSIAGGQETLGAPGNRKYTRKALVRVEVFTAPATGMAPSDPLVQRALDIFEGRRLLGSGVMLYDASPIEAGLVDDGRWSLSTAQAYFDYEQIK